MNETDIEKDTASQSRNDAGAEQNGEGEKRYVVRHNKQDVSLTFGELVKNAEKGLDYDRIRSSHDYVKALAEKNGESDVSHFIAKMKDEQSGDTDAADAPQPQRDMPAESEMEVIAKEYPQYIKNGTVELPREALLLHESGMGLAEACRAADLKMTKELCAKLTARLEAKEANRANADASIGSLSGGEAPQKDFYTSQEWDKLPQRDKEKFIKSGKIFEFMKKWSGRQG